MLLHIIIILKKKPIKMLKLQMSLYFFTHIQWMILIPIYLCLSPLCMISSSLFDWTLKYIIDDQTITLITILVLQWMVSAVLILELIWNRTGNAIFFYQFVFFLTCSNCILIGVTYSLLQRNCLTQQLTAKIFTSLFLVLLAQKLKIKYRPEQGQNCIICCEEMNDQSIILKCKHAFHEDCLWKWMYVKQQCPICKKII